MGELSVGHGAVVGEPALVDLDRQVRDVERGEHGIAIDVDLARVRGHDRDDAAAAARPELPDVQVGDADVVDRLELLANDLLVRGDDTTSSSWRLACRHRPTAHQMITRAADEAHRGSRNHRPPTCRATSATIASSEVNASARMWM